MCPSVTPASTIECAADAVCFGHDNCACETYTTEENKEVVCGVDGVCEGDVVCACAEDDLECLCSEADSIDHELCTSEAICVSDWPVC